MLRRGTFLGLVILLVGAAPAVAAEPAMVWSQPEPITVAASITGIDCPTTELCVAVDQRGNAITTTDPTGPAGNWTSADIVQGEEGINAVSCASADKCVAVGANGLRLTSYDPTAGSAAWTETEISGAAGLQAVSCSGETCAAFDNENRIVVWGKPSGGGVEVTKLVEVNGGAFVPDDVDCPTGSFCVVLGTEGHELGGGFIVEENAVVTLTDPVGPSLSFTHHFLGNRTWLRALSCPTASFCVAVDEEGNDWVSTEPTSATWESHLINPGNGIYDNILFDVSCPSEDFCAAVGNPDGVLTSKHPLGAAEDWASAYLGPRELLSCPSPSLCLAAGEDSISVGTPAPPPAPEEKGGEEAGGFSSAPPPLDQRPIQGPPPPLLPLPRLRSPKPVVVKKGKVIVPLSCISEIACSGEIKLFASRNKIATGRFLITPNRTKGVAVPLNRREKDLLAAVGKAAAQLSVDGWSGNKRLSLRKAVVLRQVS